MQALLRQQFDTADYELIVVTDGPDELTCTALERMLKTAGPNVQCISTDKKRGPAAARNAGWQQAKGELIVFTDDDCIPAPGFLRAYWDAYQHHQQPAAAFTGKLRVPVNAPPTDYEQNTAHLETAEFVTANCACTKSALQLVHGFDESFTMAWREDSELEFRLLQHHIPIYRVPAAKVVHPVRSAPWGISLKEQKKSMYNALLYKKHPQLYRYKISKQPQWNYYAILLLFCFSLLSVLFSRQSWLWLVPLSGWLLLTAQFAVKRLRGTSHAPSHVMEMIVTSLLIPFLSIYWTLYGAFRFKVFFL